MMNIKCLLWIGMNLSTKEKIFYLDNNVKFLSAHVSQDMVFQEFSKRASEVLSLNSYRIQEYPKIPIFFHRGDRWTDGVGQHVSVPYLNLLFFSHFTKLVALLYAARDYRMALKSDDTVIVVYSMHSIFLILARFLKRNLKKCKLVLIIPDHPMHMRGVMPWHTKFLKYIDFVLLSNNLKVFDSYLVYSKFLIQSLKLPADRCLIFEGAINREKALSIRRMQNYEVPNRLIFMYSGALNSAYKIESLMDAFCSIEDGPYLWITGSGELENKIIDVAERFECIKYFGSVPYSEMLALQAQASAFINMRDPSGPGASLSFPSKIFEYMCTCKPILSVKMTGIPKEYESYIDFFDDIALEKIVSKLESYDPVNYVKKREKFAKAFEFIIKNKTIEARVSDVISRI